MRLFSIRTFPVMTILVGSVFALWFFATWDHTSFNYRLTYVVEVNGEKRIGSGVIKVHAEDTSQLPVPGAGFGFSAEGEAVVVDLGEGRYLFSLLNQAQEVPYRPFANRRKAGQSPLDVMRELAREKPSILLPGEQLPMLVTFRDINDPKSVQQVNADHLSAVFGSDVSLVSVTLEFTDRPVTTGRVYGVLRWLSDSQVMENPGWSELPLQSRRAIGMLLTRFPDLED